jgi:16S rRNA (cytosine1402-N4)-methyltransferase
LDFHKPVLLKETVGCLDIRPGGKYIDCTFGFGGHSKEILKKGGHVLGLDSDKESLATAKKKLKANLILENANFANLEEIAKEHKFTQINGILYDLGLSSWQLEQSGRGFSFQRNEPLDMRSDLTLKVTAADLVNSLSKNELTKIFTRFGEERRAGRFASALVRARRIKKISTTFDLLEALGLYTSRNRIHPATKVFQALRIAVNSELLSLSSSLHQAQKLLLPGGRLVIISFHSLEDRIVKDFGRKAESLKILTKKPIVPSSKEIALNPRARSAKLRAFEKI